MQRRRSKHVDYVFVIIGGFLLVAGLFILTSASFGLAELKFDTPYFYISRQLTAVAIGLGAMFIASKIHYRFWRKAALPILIFSVGLLLILFIPKLGTDYNKGAVRWLSIGPISFQPVELVKIAFIIYIAAWLDAKKKEIKSFSHGFIPFIFIVSFVGLFLVLQPNISSFIIIAGASLILYFIGGGKSAQIAGAVLLGGLLIVGFMYVVDYNFTRLLVFLHPESDPLGSGYQIKQSLIAIGSGGILGKGFGLSELKYKHLPEPVGDSIFAVFSEELGFTGNLTLIILFLFFFWRGMLIAVRAPDRFGQLLAAGIMLIILLQVVVNIGSFTGLLPITGIPLPFISYGRSAMVALLGSLGILLNISRYAV
ncbi:MAG: cell division protein FtsW [Candidatus Ryanbacteria bacterium RIFCSPHIGHO2_02_FULL_45_43]|uniref:Probable peptidoglycan glycosyltransferase FtsW n=1 Tax=Candidatus Ryanbacteria bacterium RIFCSPHIGHO2_01_45_13 TaxID=1802112 RepID=A0A1G2FY11_9BACT|nr:MAG: cell division protein FtsW [Candidatus Ryanbacteria bacterium RIFCSPHIGHO2_01_FULL_44_130]OGZ42963.1 MAG: cell division protein FtsW [Candidatus Ryanbacteria bacterium RIFCSPHIGHO2_01_45_13]OGZ48668.1 MAG: cell division protein FtsW [Candidatus Ryanbacteria bacterium RIFCSPHIGHO2_02_FULL_45_43]OGZ50608.1 MAG: cell division protein FtsW [Candidatus Ryanbacteria bacterium RIFCSPHIGHO2_12_FULL_44_20]OGZ51914.1 MAG: cell division protein FtsW [Candidatus Ryanbacteria bacterium RIFCSPLOWO2_0